jgi:hypothetical protein
MTKARIVIRAEEDGMNQNSNLNQNEKEVIQGHLPVPLPCYDFTMINSLGVGTVFLS